MAYRPTTRKALKGWDNFQKPLFQRNGFYESILEMRSKNPKTFEGLSPATKLTLAAYEKAKRQAEADREAVQT